MYNSRQDPSVLDATERPSVLVHTQVQVPNTSKPAGNSSGFATGIETELTVSPDVCTVNSAPVGSLISSTFVPLGVVIVQPKERLVLGPHMMVRMSTLTPGSIHKSQPIAMSTIMKNWVGSIGGGGVSHSRTGGPISGGRQLRYMNGEQNYAICRIAGEAFI